MPILICFAQFVHEEVPMPEDQKTDDVLLDAIIEASIIPAADGEWLMLLMLNRELSADAYRGVTAQIGEDENFESTGPHWVRLKFTVIDGTVVHAIIVPESRLVLPASVPGELLSPFGEILLVRNTKARLMHNARSRRSFEVRPVPVPSSTPTN